MSSLPRDPFAGEPAPGSAASELADRQRRVDPRLGDGTLPDGRRPRRGLWLLVAVGLAAGALWGVPVVVGMLAR